MESTVPSARLSYATGLGTIEIAGFTHFAHSSEMEAMTQELDAKLANRPFLFSFTF